MIFLHRSMSSCESNSVIKEKSSLTEQNSTELPSGSFSRDDADESSSNTATNGKTSSTSWTTPTRTNLNGSASLDSGTDGSIISAKAKRNRPLIRQQCVKKDNEKESHGIGEDNQLPPATTSTLQPILPKYVYL